MATPVRSADNEVSAREQKRKEEREQLRQHFMSLPPEKQSHAWDDFWREGKTPWDRDQPNPALVDALQDKPEILGSPWNDTGNKKTRKTVLVPGCGRGYDVLLFSSYGFNAVGLDISPTAIEEARKLQADQSKDQQYPVKNVEDGRGEVRFITADFFMDNFLSETHGTPDSDRQFDVIYDYTFLCALPPKFRPQWAARMSRLLSTRGRLICMEYPLGKDPKLGGPPHGLESESYEQLLAKPGQEMDNKTGASVCADHRGDKNEDALVRIEHWVPKRTFDGQADSLMVSVWRHWKS